MPVHHLKTSLSLLATLVFTQISFAHNGKIAHAKPLPAITVDGNTSEWPKNTTKYPIAFFGSDTKAKDAADFSGYFHVGYRLEDKSLYIALVITDDDFLEDTSANVAWNTQDGIELNIDGSHQWPVSAVSSFMYSKKLRNINRNSFDRFSKNAEWGSTAEVAMTQKGTTRYYEWRIKLNDELQMGKSIGLDFQCFDKDKDNSFTFCSWGPGEFKYRNPKSLGDVIPMPANAALSTISGIVKLNNNTGQNLKNNYSLRIASKSNPDSWVTAAIDSTGKFQARVPADEYELNVPEDFFENRDTLYNLKQDDPVFVTTKPGNNVNAQPINVTVKEVSLMIPEKGVLHNFDASTPEKIDDFIATYQHYLNIPGVSLAIIKDGKVVYNKTYGLRNSITKQKVDENTIFEAASITKPVFAYAVQRLADRGEIDLDKPLYEYLPYEDIAYDERYKLITGRHVLTHRTGFPNWRWMNSDNKLDLKFTPGTDFGYSGEGFEYLKKVVEKITGKKVEQVLKEEVIDQVGLYHTFFSKNDSLKTMVADGHYDEMPVFDELNDEPGMAWSMRTEALIFTRFMLHLAEQKGLKEETYKTMFSKHSDYKLEPDDKKPKYPTYMGMSLEIRETPFGMSFGHGGNNGDFKCNFEMYKDAKMGYVIFTNSNTSDLLLYVLNKFLVEGREGM